MIFSILIVLTYFSAGRLCVYLPVACARYYRLSGFQGVAVCRLISLAYCESCPVHEFMFDCGLYMACGASVPSHMACRVRDLGM